MNIIGIPESEYDVVIVGGGFAGVAASVDLTAAGISVLIVEARDRLSGRMWFEPAGLDGHPVEWGGAFMLDREAYPLVWAIIDREGLELDWGSLDDTDLIWLTQNTARRGALPVPLEELDSFDRSVRHVETLASKIDPHRALSEQDLSAVDIPWSEVFAGLDIGPHTLDAWRAHVVNLAGDDWHVPSALPLLHEIAETGSLAAATMFAAPYNTPMAVTLGPQLANGTASLFEAVQSRSTADVVLDSPVSAIRDLGDHVEIDAPFGIVRAGHVVSAVPINVIGDIHFDPPTMPELTQLAREGVAGRAQKLTVLVSDCARPWYGHGIPEGGGFATASTTWHEGDRAVVVAFTHAPGVVDPDDHRAVERLLRAYVPDITVEAVRSHDWLSDPYSRGTWSYLRPGQTVARATARKHRGRVFFAGSDFDRRLGVEGAIHSGSLAAAEVLAERTAEVGAGTR